MSPEYRTVMEFCLEHAASAPVSRRVKLYRGLAEFCGDDKMAAEFRSLAMALELADAQCREFEFQFANPQLAAVGDARPIDGEGKV